MISAQAAKKQASAYLRDEGSGLSAVHASRDKKHGVWVVGYRDPKQPDETLDGGALVVTDEGEVHSIGSTPDAVDHLMESLGRGPWGAEEGVWSREDESLALLADEDTEEAAGLVALAASRRPWPAVLGEELEKPYFRELMRFIDLERLRGAVYPPPGDMFAAFHLTPYEKVKVVILGQDPYHQPDHASGLCFSVPRDIARLPTSLRNIQAAMVRDGFTPPPHGDLTSWARQDVLLLNTALTVRDAEPNSHAKEWREFTAAVITKLNERRRPIVFVLWGNPAQSTRDLIDEDRHEVITAPHPSARGLAQTQFREAGTFAEVNRRLKALDAGDVDWGIA
ncbi:uracil-DNA glycosylase [Ornithinimicrobium sufpigmenti]|uniref:uracil-DNA glycosylase n=1 Tax=Ornithinimicrobium sufpigmenti TaxID=2508882 RepID=UPI00192DEC54|nr:MULTISPECIES: uracil-DNA glycosylase [unclassified Ornithinimicrobium]